MKPVAAGRLKRRISVDEAHMTQSSSGAPIVSWITRGTTWGSIEPLRGREATQANQILGTMDTRIMMRIAPQIAALNPKWRLRSGGIIYDIISVADVEMAGRVFEVMCKSGTNKG